MKAFLLAAGHGTRLRPLTDTVPKCLLPIRGVPLLQIWLDICARHYISELLINVHAHAQAVRDFLQSSTRNTIVRIAEEPELLGSAGTILANKQWIATDECFWIFYADVLHHVDLSAMLRLHHIRKPAATMAVYRVPDPTRCGIVEVNPDNTIVDFVEKPAKPRSNLAFSGILIGTPSLTSAIPLKKPADLAFDVFPQLVGNMVAHPTSNFLLDIGTLENYQLAQTNWVPASNSNQ